jgi:hypothetical protein
MLGVEYTNNILMLQLQDPVHIKIFNIFNKKDTPFNYNIGSNNGWLEVFISGNFIAYI